jgi:acyl-CoA synthetase (AMP-forming)/AMP-acid ligase II
MKKPLPLDLAATILDCLEHYATVIPDARAYTFLVNGEDQERVLSYRELQTRAKVVGNALRCLGLSKKAVLLLFPSGLDFIVAFFGCLYAGAVAVPANLARNSHHYSRLRQIIRDSQSMATLTTNDLRGSVQDGLLSAGVDTVEVPVLTEAAFVTHVAEKHDNFEVPMPADLAFLQYTSGSTGQPKGVMITHAQLIANERAIQRSTGLPEHLKGGGWLPQFHDMGLIGATLQPVALGGHYVFLSPLHFIQRPLRWLQMLSRYQCAASAAPNFALEMCVKAGADLQTPSMDLSRLDTIFCGAEPVSAQTLSKFEARFSSNGLQPNTVKACYGLAEATLMVSGGLAPVERTMSLDRSAVDAGRVINATDHTRVMSVVCCGTPIVDHQTIIVDPSDGRILTERQIGEIWFSGPSVASGYWRNPGSTAATFQAKTACGQGPYMRTGDLGFLCDDGLFITGRIKELMIIRGRNVYPHDIEATLAEAMVTVSEVQAAVFAAGSAEAPEVVAFLELPRKNRLDFVQNVPDIVSTVRHAVTKVHDVHLHHVYFVLHGTIPRTSSGKTQRSQCVSIYASGEIDNSPSVLYSTRQAAELNQATSLVI